MRSKTKKESTALSLNRSKINISWHALNRVLALVLVRFKFAWWPSLFSYHKKPQNGTYRLLAGIAELDSLDPRPDPAHQVVTSELLEPFMLYQIDGSTGGHHSLACLSVFLLVDLAASR
jgi:hypothetical protein